MSTIPHVAVALQDVFTDIANQAARTSGFIQRQRNLTGASFVQALVFGWLANPHMSLDQLAQMAAVAGTPISAQGLAQRFTSHAAVCLQTVLAAAVSKLIAAEPVALPLLERFTGVYVLDSTTIMLPDALESIWQGNGGATSKGTSAALKVQVLWNVKTGEMRHLELDDGRANDNGAAVQDVALPAGSLRIADLGYFSLDRVAAFRTHDVHVLSRLPSHVNVSSVAGERYDLVKLLERHATPTLDREVTLGNKQLPMRLLAVRVPQEVLDQRRRRLRQAHRQKGKVPKARTLALLAWTILVTTLPKDQLSVQEAVVLLRARWQIELLFKLWKSQGEVDRWASEQPWRILCEVYAKLLTMLVVHWVVLVSCWQYPNRSLSKAAQTVRHHALVLSSALTISQDSLITALEVIERCLTYGGRINSRKAKQNTYQLLTSPLSLP